MNDSYRSNLALSALILGLVSWLVPATGYIAALAGIGYGGWVIKKFAGEDPKTLSLAYIGIGLSATNLLYKFAQATFLG